MRGQSEVPELRLATLKDFVTMWTAPPEIILSNLFPEADSDSSTIKWESKEGGRGMTPFKPPGAPSPVVAVHGVAQHSAEAAFWGEKMFFDEEFLNNLRREGTTEQYKTAQQHLAEGMSDLTNRNIRRKEWMFSKMLFSGTMSYEVKLGYRHSVDYGIRTDHIVTLATDYKWQNGTKRDILGDIIDGKKKIKEDCGGTVDFALCNSTVLRYIAQDTNILTLLQKSAFGQGDLFQGTRNNIVGVNPGVLGSLLDIKNFIIYDEQYEVRSYLTAAVTASTTTSITVEDASDFEVGGTLRFYDVSAGTYEDETISAVDEQAGTVTVSSAPATSYKATEDYVSMVKYFIGSDQFCMFAKTVEGKPIAKYYRAPYGIPRGYGRRPKIWEKTDPDGIFIRVEDKGLPVLVQRDAVYILDVN